MRNYSFCPLMIFYLKPAVSLELLRLLQMISVPNLFFLIMGDIKTMEALFFEKALADWTAVAGPQVYASLDDQRKNEVLSRVREMKARYLRKLLPTAQRSIMEWSKWDEALRYRPTATKPSSDTPKRLSALLKAVHIESVEHTESPDNLLNWLVGPLYVEPGNKRQTREIKDGSEGISNRGENGECNVNHPNKFQEAYSATQVLDVTPREVADLWMRLGKLQHRTDNETDDIPSYLWMVVDSLLLAIEEQDFLTEQQQDTMRWAFPASHEDNFLIETCQFVVVPKSSPPIHVDKQENVFLRKHLDWNVGVRNDCPSRPNDCPSQSY